jgi:hypothetical protein
MIQVQISPHDNPKIADSLDAVHGALAVVEPLSKVAIRKMCRVNLVGK